MALHPRRTWFQALPLLVLLVPAQARQTTPQATQAPRASEGEVLAECAIQKPKELFDVLRVVDGDTIWIQRNGQREKLRLLSVDTEEKYHPGSRNDPRAKPSTRFGSYCAAWTAGFFAAQHPDQAPVQVGLRFPGDREARDIYGRLLCHVVTAQGVDFNLLLVRKGMSPYFNKYGNSLIDHKAFQSAQEAAKKERLGIWSPETNQGGTRRDYAKLVPWWQLRANAVESFRALVADKPLDFVEAENPDALTRAVEAGPRQVTAFGLIDRFFEEDDGSQTVLFRSGDKRRALRVVIPPEHRSAMEKLDLHGSLEDYRQNYWRVTGTIEQGKRGPQIICDGPVAWQLAK